MFIDQESSVAHLPRTTQSLDSQYIPSGSSLLHETESKDQDRDQEELRPDVDTMQSHSESTVSDDDIVEAQPYSNSENFSFGIREHELVEIEHSVQQSPSSTHVQDGEKSCSLGENDEISSTAQILPPSGLQSKGRRLRSAWLTAIAAFLVTVFSVFYSYRVLVSHSAVPKDIALSPGKTVLIVNILSHIVAFLCWNLFVAAAEALRWSLACRPNKGILFTSFLSLGRATPFLGLWDLSLKKGPHQIWCVIRLLSMTFYTTVGLILIADITFRDIYNIPDSSVPIKVIAGTAPFNTDFVSAVPVQILSIFSFSYTMSFLTDQRYVVSIPPTNCNSDDCSSDTSVFLPGSLDLVRLDNGDQNPTFFTSDFSGDSVLIDGAPGYQVEFSSVDPDYKFDSRDCNMYMNSLEDGLHMCIASSGPQMLIGWTICPDPGAQCNANGTWTETPDQSTSVTMYKRYATTAYDLKNLSILSIESISPPETTSINITDFALFCALLLGPIPPVLNFTSDANAYQIGATKYAIQYALGSVLRELQQYAVEYNTYNNGGLSLLQSLIAMSFQFSTEIWQQVDPSSLPLDMKVTAKLTTTSYRAIAPSWTLWTFGVMSFAVLLWSIICLIWVHLWGANSPNSSNFPEIDITSKSSFPASVLQVANHEDAEAPYESMVDLGNSLRISGLGNGPAALTLNSIRDKKIYCGSYTNPKNGEPVMLIVTEKGIVSRLKKHTKYA